MEVVLVQPAFSVPHAVQAQNQGDRPNSASVLAAALAALERGWSIIPVRGRKPAFDLLPRRNGKATWKPFQRRRPSPATVREWFRKDPSIGFAVVTGSVSGIVVLDVDPRNGGDVSGKPIPPTPVEETPRGGRHYYFRDPGGVRGHVELAPGVELIGEGGYVVCSPSPGYAWYETLTPDDVEPADCPAWVLSSLSSLVTNRAPTSQVTKMQYWLLGRGQQNEASAPRAALPVRGDALLTWCRQLEFGIAAAAFLGLPTGGLAEHGRTSAFLCRLPGHDERNPSASLFFEPERCGVAYRCWHTSKPGGDRWYSLPAVFAALRYGEIKQLSDSELVTWSLRLLVETGFVAPVRIEAPDLPPGTPEFVRRVWQGFLLLLGCRWLHTEGEPAPFTWRFAAAWCGVSEWQAKEARKWLLDMGYMRKAGEVNCGLRRMSLWLPAGASATRRRSS